MALFKIVIQKPVMGRSHPKEAELVANRRVYLVEAKNEAEAEGVFRGSGEAILCGLVAIERCEKPIVLLHP